MRSLSSKVGRIRASPIRKLAALMEKAGEDPSLISFGGGAPSLAPPRELMDELGRLARDPSIYKYGSTQGKPELRGAISDDLKKKGLEYPADQIALTVGCTEAIFLALMALLNPGDTATLTDPCYLGYPEIFKFTDTPVAWIPLQAEDNYQPTPDAVDEAVTKKTKAIVIASPDNPTGGVLTKQSTKLLADAAIDNDCYIIHDETYRDIIYDNTTHYPLAKFAPDNSIMCMSFSKCASIPGLRLGFAYAPAEIINAIEKLQQYTILCPDTLSQALAARFMQGKTYPEYVKKQVIPTYTKRRDAMEKSLKKHLPQARFTKPEGAFYYFPDMSAYMGGKTEEAFCQQILEKARVAIIPGNFFGNKAGLKHVRMTFVSEPESRIEEGIKRIKELVA